MTFVGPATRQYLLLLWLLVVHEAIIPADVADRIETVDMGFSAEYFIIRHDIYDTYDYYDFSHDSPS
jgi:hypothetical protein